jgi:hypothetical protein
VPTLGANQPTKLIFHDRHGRPIGDNATAINITEDLNNDIFDEAHQEENAGDVELQEYQRLETSLSDFPINEDRSANIQSPPLRWIALTWQGGLPQVC